MKKIWLVILAAVIVSSCAPVLQRELMEKGIRHIPFSELKKDPGSYKGRLFVLGGIIVETRNTDEGSLIEAVYVPVDDKGYLGDIELSSRRFQALYPARQGLLDPLIFHRKREVTIAGKFIETRDGKIGEMTYTYPVFEIQELYLWEKQEPYYITPVYPSWYDHYPYGYPFYWDDPRWGYYYPAPYWYGPFPRR